MSAAVRDEGGMELPLLIQGGRVGELSHFSFLLNALCGRLLLQCIHSGTVASYIMDPVFCGF